MSASQAEYIDQGPSIPPYGCYSVTKPQFQATLDATRAVLTDPALPQGAKALWQYYLEFSFVPDCGGLRAGSIFSPVDYTASRIHATLNSVCIWKKLLKERGHLWIEQFKTRARKPWEIIHISCLIPRDEQTDLFSIKPAPHLGIVLTHYFGKRAVTEKHNQSVRQNGNQSVHQNGNQSASQNANQPDTEKRNVSTKGVQDLGGRGELPPLRRMLRHEIKEMQTEIEAEIKKLRGNSENFKEVIFKRPSAQWLEHAAEKIKKLCKSKTAEAQQQLEDYQRRIKEVERDRTNWDVERMALNPSAAARMANLTRNLEAVKNARLGIYT